MSAGVIGVPTPLSATFPGKVAWVWVSTGTAVAPVPAVTNGAGTNPATGVVAALTARQSYSKSSAFADEPIPTNAAAAARMPTDLVNFSTALSPRNEFLSPVLFIAPLSYRFRCAQGGPLDS